ncbi:hypothetical protein HMPREF1062_02270 [Bacteroides cellulosilyticus CL02T12C19]|uniref:Alpha-L-rhamnosidase six-hairpin glycosidase domain-containing protein n=1 Tax=Bacteroides cellulosilyticus CL02T12C19 TaxID=997874 RepID=I8W2S9_9BACE|nr:alpha-L-rhamnosidase C-terminal domain-containing protein [Bacteroides cellulosilyticus]EIY32087.1 hypothetical protein HMPREF1062_02270 [Bacteroides cellulosilyticus CL02T12C19]
MKFIVTLLLCLVSLSSFGYDWKAYWISTDACQSEPNTWLSYRKTVHIVQVPDEAIARIAADSKYWLWINDNLVVFEGGLKRGPNPEDTYYDEVDIAPYLKAGSNTIAALVWYFGKQGFSHNSSGKAGFLFDCQTSGIEIISDNSWTCCINEAYSTCSGPKPNFRLSESSILYDARKEMEGWVTQSFKSSFPGASKLQKAGGAPWNKLVKRPIPLWKDFGLKNYVKSYKSKDTLICVLPYNAQFTPYIKIKSPEGCRIVMGTDNYYYYNGATENLRAEYITKAGIQEYESLGWMNGHRMYYFIPEEVEVLDVKYRETGYDCDLAGSFYSSDAFLNQLWRKSLRTLYVTMRDTYMDCPERERAQWTGDAVNESGESFYALSPSSHALTKKWLCEIIDWQQDDGSIFAPVPAGNWRLELPGQTLASVGYYGAWNYYLHTGDKITLHHLYPAIKRYMELWKENETGVVSFRNVGWVWGDWGSERDMFLLINVWYYLALKGMYQMALELGYTNDADSYIRRMTSFKNAFNTHYWTGIAYRDSSYKGKTDDRVQALAVVAGLADKDKYEALLNIFKTEKHSSPYMEKYVFEAMMMMGYEVEALARHKERMKYMVEDPYFSTLFEHWNIGIEGYAAGTVNHAWTGGGLTILSQYLCGIAPLKPGYEQIAIVPQPGNIRQAKAEVASVKGMIKSSFVQEEKGITIDVKTPADIPTVVGVPINNTKEIRVNGTLIWKQGAYRINRVALAYEDDSQTHIKFLVRGGNYMFQSINH